MKKILLLGMLFAAAVSQAQFIGYVGLQATVTKFSIPVAATASTFPIPNLGQTGHSVQFQWTVGATCGFNLDGSTDGVNWIMLASGQGTSSGFPTQFLYANGYFSVVRLKVNPVNTAACAGTTLTGVYVGYQTPLPLSNITQGGNPGPISFTTPVNVTGPAGGGNLPVLLTSLQCYNPNATVAFVQVFFSSAAPGLGGANNANFGVAAVSTWSYVGPPLFGLGEIWLGAATTAGGTTAVATPVVCQASYSFSGPFYPVAQSDNP
jgi:hypothetical protein